MKEAPTGSMAWNEVCDGCNLPEEGERCVVARERVVGDEHITFIDGSCVFSGGAFVSAITRSAVSEVTHWARFPK